MPILPDLAVGIRTVVRGGSITLATSISSKPIIFVFFSRF